MPEAPAIDASPLIILSQGGRLDLLKLVADRIVVPRPVAIEVQRPERADAATQALRSISWLEVVEVDSAPAEVRHYQARSW